MPLLVIASVVGYTLLLGLVSWRLLGVPVGWIRTFLVSLVLATGGGAVMRPVAEALGVVVDQDGAVLEPSNQGLAAAVLLLIYAWGIALGLGVLVILEALVPTGTVPSLTRFLRDLPARRRRSKRYARIVALAVRHGLGGFLSSRARTDLGDQAPQVARSLREAMTEAGVTYVKLGQMIATRPDLVGEAFARELGQLQSDVPAEPWEVVRATLVAELGRPPEEVFAHVEPEPLAAASVGQVHRATLLDGTAVVLKVQRSDAQAQVSADLDIVLRLARWLDRVTDWGHSMDVRTLAEGFATSLTEELDYRTELANMAAVAEATRATREGVTVRVPTAYSQLSGPRLLVMEEVRGAPVSRARDRLDSMPGARRADLAQALLGSVLRQVLGTGVFHADLHAGNVFLADDGSLVLLDLGSVGRLDAAGRGGIGRLLLAVDRRDSIAATDALLEVLDRGPGLDDQRLEREVGALISRVGHLGSTGSAGLFPDLFSMVVRHGLSVPPQIAAVFRALGALEGTLRQIDPAADLGTASRASGREFAREQLTPDALRGTLEEQVARMLPLLQRLPRRVDALAEALHRGELSVNVRLLADARDRSFVTGLVQQLTMTLLAGACAIAGIMLVVSDTGPALAPDLLLYPLLGATLFLFGFVLAARALVLVFRRTALPERGRRRR
ncbi:AarF/UbiB family protein [Ornithinimicrobium sp. F0845]|uniref:ABC1 kinase family protein n=1 Tax=Ornithinimicrobium sp. F0845 TaxID=2926412 RepID=UPI001FF1B892|nr:AarF/UbiB family protein [Ornithinimicrobium sp. F0845]MCK0112895.1 AarF/UbiB family protein [Ornithinimicrobium sp. F0845]